MGTTDFDVISAEEITEMANRKGKDFHSVKTNQIRNFFSGVSSIRQMAKAKKNTEDLCRELILLKPKLAYAAGRKKEVKLFAEFMIGIIDKTVNATDKTKAINNFFVFVEALVAYHKYHGGKDN